MAEVRKREQSREAGVVATRSNAPRSASLRPSVPPPPRFFEALDPSRPLPPRAPPIVAAPLFVGALLIAAVVRSMMLRVLLPLALAVVAIGILLRGSRRRPTVARRGVEIGPRSVMFNSGGPAKTELIAFDAPFGVTLLGTHSRDRIVAILSSSRGTFYVGARVDDASRSDLAPLLERASTVAPDENGLEAIGPDGEPLMLAPLDLASLITLLERSNPGCLEAFHLTDVRGDALELFGGALTLGDRTLDLGAALEWRSIVFQEAFGQAVFVWQGTWVRQGSIEVVLVSPLPSIAPHLELDVATLDRAAIRDKRLAPATPEAPPPHDQRIAVERLFMLPIRAALDKAPRPSRKPYAAHT
jgi:hypothetical protein